MPHSDIHGSKPARGSPWLFAACHVLHRLLVPRHPPNALLILKIMANPKISHITHHAQEPSTPKKQSMLRTHAHRPIHSAHTRRPHTPITEGGDPQNASERSCRHVAWQTHTHAHAQICLTGQTSRPTTRPETHQNLIHTDKEQNALHTQAKAQMRSNTNTPIIPTTPQGVWAQWPRTDCFSVTITEPTQRKRQGRCQTQSSQQRKMQNRMVDTTQTAWWTPCKPHGGHHANRMVDIMQTAWWTPRKRRGGHHANGVVEVNGFEPMTPCLQSRCSPS